MRWRGRSTVTLIDGRTILSLGHGGNQRTWERAAFADQVRTFGADAERDQECAVTCQLGAIAAEFKAETGFDDPAGVHRYRVTDRSTDPRSRSTPAQAATSCVRRSS